MRLLTVLQGMSSLPPLLKMSAVLNKQFFSDLWKLLRSETAELNSVVPRWPQVCRILDAECQRLLRCIPKDDPIRRSSDLLSPLGSGIDEVRHTQAIAYLFDPLKSHGFRSAILEQFIRTLRRSIDSRHQEIDEVLRLVRSANDLVKVTPERRHRLAGARAREVAIIDIWIEIHASTATGLIVIENKISARESERQLEDYETVARNWCRRYHNCSALLVYLTADGRNPESASSGRWLSASYSQLAHALREALKQNKQAEAAAWLQLYITSIARYVSGLRLEDSDTLDITKLQQYVGAASR